VTWPGGQVQVIAGPLVPNQMIVIEQEHRELD